MRHSIATVALVVRDYEEALAYFTTVLRFQVREDRQLSPDKRWLLVAPAGSTGAGLLLAKASGPEQAARIGDQTGGRVFLLLETDDFWETHRHLTAHGVTFAEEPRNEPYGTVAVFLDLYGNKWDLIEHRKAIHE